MRKSFGVKPSVYPEPVFIIASYNSEGKVECMNAAWGGLVAKTELMLCLNPAHKTVIALRETGAFSVSMGQADMVASCDYVGIVSGNNEPDKFAKSGFHATKAEAANAPLIDELAYSLVCTLKSYDEESHVLIATIEDISVDERVLDADGNIDVAKLAPLSFDPNTKSYYKITEKVADARTIGKTLID